jgi:hypothetical protein
MAMSILLLILGIPEALIFSIPARIPIIRQRAMSHSVFRWVVIVLLSVVVTFVNYLGWIEVSVKEEIIFSSITDACWDIQENCAIIEYDAELRVLNIDLKLWDEFEKELILRRLFFNREGQCFSNNSDICETTTIWHSSHQWRRGDDYITLADQIRPLIYIVIFLLPSILTGYFVHRITRNNRKQKRGE